MDGNGEEREAVSVRAGEVQSLWRTLQIPSIQQLAILKKLEISQHSGKEEGGELGIQSHKVMFSYVALVGKRFKRSSPS